MTGALGAEQIAKVSLAWSDWTIYQVQPKYLHYSLRWEDISFIFDLYLPNEFNAGEKSLCRQEAEDILYTFEIVDDRYPTAVKGYELYSWYVEDEALWFYTLITGANRLKTYNEVTWQKDIITEAGWEKITVKGSEHLQYILSLLPRGTVVTWHGKKWLKEVNAEARMGSYDEATRKRSS